ncbi:hypothetical protein FQA39_LY01442 [Lamprigera yunnana]|nr:hypothetical protein FQA39_LY01442 [Lamprigera yunnana]
MSAKEHESVIFNNLSMKFSQLLYGRTKDDRSRISYTLDEINNLNYRYPIVTITTKAVLLIHQCCTIVPPDDPELVTKSCTLFTNLLVHQQVELEGQTLSLLMQWCVQGIKCADTSVTIAILTVLKVLLNLKCLLSIVIGNNSPIITIANSDDTEVALLATQCLEMCTLSEDLKNKEYELSLVDITCNVFIKHLIATDRNQDSILQNKILFSSLRGLQNVITIYKECLERDLALLLGIAKSYMLYNIKGVNFEPPQKILPSVLNVLEVSVNIAKEKKGGKIAKQRKPRLSSKKEVKKSDNDDDFININIGISGYQSSPKISDSDYSDTEHRKVLRLGVSQDQVRQAALNFFLQIIRLTDKATIFCYWSHFISDGSGFNNLNLCILKDPSPNGRMAALHVLLTLITRAKLYLIQAESSEKRTAFTPFSVILGSMVLNLHKCLSLALNEKSVIVLLQVLKCLAALVQASPYHKLVPGILRKVIRNVKIYITHRYSTVQIASLIVFECILGSEPIVSETKDALVKRIIEPKVGSIRDSLNKVTDDIECVSFSSDEEDSIPMVVQDVPWLLRKCLNNLGVYFKEDVHEGNVISAAVKVQSLQVISAMTRNYFDCLIVPHLVQIAKALDVCLMDNYVDLRLHAGRTVDFIGQAMNQHLSTTKSLTTEQGLVFWQILINSSLAALLQCEQHAVLRSVGCDCFASIGPHIFEHFSRDKQILIVTLLFPCSHDEDNNVKAAAVRALAISILYPSLRDDPGFVVDVAETILRVLQDSSIIVLIKASWSLGNLSDALVLNNADSTKEQIPENLLLRLLKIAVKISNDHEKIKVNAVRALGNLLQLVTAEMFDQIAFKEATEAGLESLVRNSTTGTNMKVRWNSCYGIGSVLKNSNHPINNYKQRETLFQSLMNLVVDFPNFKVRINAASALASLNNKEQYGDYFFKIWKILLNALENTQNIEDFSEHNHRDHLVEEICLTLGHLATLLKVEDLTLIKDNTQLHYELLQLQMRKVSDRLLPEKSTILLLAATHLTSMKIKSLSKNQNAALSYLLKIFVNK